MKMRFYTLGLAILLLVVTAPMTILGADAQPAAKRWAVRPLAEIVRHRAPPVDTEALAREDRDRREQGLPFRFAQNQDVSLTTDDSGTWETLPSGRSLWRLRIFSPDVLSLNLGFTRFWLPAGAHLLVYPAAEQAPVQVYDENDNAVHGQLWTGVLLTDEAVIELEVDSAVRWQVELELTSIGRGYRLFGEDFSEKSGYCNVDVVCEEGDDWRDEIDTVAGYSYGGSLFCTGYMINNVEQDGTPYFMTAYHCDVRANLAPSLVVYWNFQKPECRTGSGSLTDFQNGATLKAEYPVSDMALLELDDLPDPAFNVKYAGWNRSTDIPTSAVCIHHPSGDEKSISFENDPVTVTSYQSNFSPGDGTHLRVGDWDVGTTEPGSSGSPLFDQDHRVVGQLHGGGAACGNNLPDWYGRFYTSWEGGGTPTTQLSSWLDPTGTGAETVDTIDPASTSFTVAPTGGFESSGAQGGPFEPMTMMYTLTNTGAEAAMFTAEVGHDWLEVVPVSGAIAVGGSMGVEVSLAASAGSLAVGLHQSTLVITNTAGGAGSTTRPVSVTVMANVTGAVPNPFGSPAVPEAEIHFTLAGGATVTGMIYDVRGQRIKDLGSMTGSAGDNHFIWDGSDHQGRSAPSGKYIFILKAPGMEERYNIILIR